MKKPIKSLITMLLVISLLMSNFAMIFTYAAIQDYPVELAFNNIFVFDKWANHPISSIVIADGVPIDKSENALVTNIENGSFTLTKKNMDALEYYTAFSMDTANASGNSSYYNMSVDPNTRYTFSYNANGTIWYFNVLVFFYNNKGLYTNHIAYSTPGYGDNSFDFTTPADATSIQIRFTINDNKTNRADNPSSVYADVKDIAIYKTKYLSVNNLFDFEGWANNTKSGSIQQSIGGTISKDIENGSFTLTTDNQMDEIYTAHSMDPNPAGNMNYYTIDVDPNTRYAFSYNLIDCNFPNFRPFVFMFNEENEYIGLFFEDAKGYGMNSFSFTTPANASHIQIRFGVVNNKTSVFGTVKDVAIYKANFETATGHPHRLSYTYGNGATYGTLPTPSNVPDGYVFAGWYTGENGDGTHITENTPVHHSSLVVYPKYEPKVDALTVATMPAKTTYTVGERFNPTGLVLNASQVVWVDEWTDRNENGVVDSGETERVEHVNSYNISSGYYCTPEYLNATGEQTITAHYGGKTATFKVNVSAYNDRNLPVNGVAHSVTIKNNEYTLNYSTSAFNRYEMTYFSDSYVKGTITFSDNYSEDFFLEPSDNGSFASYIDGYLNKALNGAITTTTRSGIKSIKFTCLDKEYGNFELLSVKTINSSVNTNDSMRYYQNGEYKVGIDLAFGGVVSYIEDLKNKPVAAVFNENGKDITKVDFSSKLDTTGAKATSNSVNLINYNDKGRYLQQSYYGTNQPPFEMGDYNGIPWNYNPVQGGNIGNEASKIIDFEITDTQIYIKTRPLDWGKNSTKYPDSYNTPSYMEAWYVFEDGMIKVYCRFVDYSGYPSNTTTQEFPALYTIEPLNNFVYHDGSKLVDIDEPDFWGVLPEYNELLAANGKPTVDVNVDCTQNWAAFTASPDDDSFGIGVYSPGISNIHYGVFPAKYNETEVKNGKLVENYRHAASLDPAQESPTSYISPVGVMTFESYKPTEYSFYISTGTAAEIQNDFVEVSNKDVEAEKAKTKIAIPETVYLNPANNKAGQYYVNNELTNALSIETVAKRDDTKMQFGVHYDHNKADSFSIKVTNVTDSTNTVTLGGYTAGSKIALEATGNYINNNYSLSLAKAIAHNDIAVVKWEITFYNGDAEVETNTAYTVLYAPMRTVGAVSESRQNSGSNNEISSWITGANGVDHQAFSPLGSWKGDIHDSGYFLEDPLYKGPKASGGESENPHDYIHTDYPNYKGAPDLRDDKGEDAYVVQAATDGHDSSRSQSYLGLLKVDKSRYTNTNQIPNLRIGFDALRVSSNASNSLENYYTMYTLGTSDSFTSTNLEERPSGWTETHYRRLASSNSLPFRTDIIPSYSVSSIDGKYIHALVHGNCQATQIYRYATAGTSVLCTVTDKAELRDSVLTGYTITKGDYPENRYNNFIDALENAATVLGDPSADQATIDLAKKELNDAIEKLNGVYYSLKYDNLFSLYEFSQHAENMKVTAGGGTATYENGTLKVVNDVITAGESYTAYGSSDNYYKVALKPNTEYVFEYDVNSTVRSQAFMFFYNQNNSNSENPTNMSIKTNNGAWVPKSESNSWWGNYTNEGTYHFVIKFTTGATTTQAGFRFGNTSNDPTISTFSNIRLVDYAHYYEDVEYSKPEDVFFEDEAYGELMTLDRPGYTFAGWKDANGKTIAPADTAVEHKSIYSQWTEHSYSITYNANGGTGFGSIVNTKYSDNVVLSNGNGYTRVNHVLTGWSTDPNATTAQYQLGQTVSKLTPENNGKVTLYAVWMKVEVNITFDNLIDFKAWNKTASNGTVSNVTNTGMTITCNAGAGEATSVSPIFPVEAGKSYKVDVDVTGKDWDIYIFFYKEGQTSGTGLEFNDSMNRYASNGGGNSSRVFTAPTGAVQAVIRLDSNNGGNAVTFNNIRVCENTGISVSPVNKVVTLDDPLGTLPTPTRSGYDFVGWVDAKGDQYTSSSIMNNTSTLNLFSKWAINSDALTSDAYVLDFGLAVEMQPLKNDTILTSSGGKYSISGISKDGNTASNAVTGAYGTFTVSDNTVKYVPNKTMNSSEVIYYHVSYNNGERTLISSITVIPATVVYYEDDVDGLIQYNDGKAADNSTNGKWSVAGKSRTESAVQTVSDDVYGYDGIYAEATDTYSMGSAHMVSVSQKNNPLGKYNGGNDGDGSWPVAEFTFAGTGFDIVSLMSQDTGLITVKVFQGTSATGNALKTWAVDTYYGYTYTNDEWTITENASNALYQIPVIGVTDLEYGTYTVQIVPTYTSVFDHKKDGSYAFYLDAIRVYEPCDFNAENSDIYGKYAADGEYVLVNEPIRDILINAKELDATSDSTGVVYINPSLNGGFEDYSTVGPKNEVYLAKGQSVAFNMTVSQIPTSVQISARSLDGGTASMRFGSTSGYSTGTDIRQQTALYYEMPFAGSSYWTDNGNGTYTTTSPIVITNNGDGILSLCNIKVTSEQLMQMEEAPVMFMMSRRSFAVAAEIAEDVSGLSPEDGALFIPDSVDAQTDSDTVFIGGKVVITVTTSGDVANLTVNNEKADLVSENEDGSKTWSFAYTASGRGTQTITLVAYNEYGYASESTELTVDVESKFEHFFTQLINFFKMIVEFFEKIFII